MNKEEARSFLIDISYKLGNMSVEYLTEKDGEKMREAIKSLAQEPSTDVISRQAVLDLVADYDLSMGQVVKGIHELPPVNPQPKTGHWKYYQNDKGDWINECSVCGSDAGVGYQYPYCPNCGAKMNEPQESEEV